LARFVALLLIRLILLCHGSSPNDQQAILRARATVLMEVRLHWRRAGLPIIFSNRQWKNSGQPSHTQKAGRLWNLLLDPRNKFIFSEQSRAAHDPSCSAMERVNGVCSDPVCSVVTDSIRAIHVSSLAEVL
jgi:hypothetical protein